MMAVVILTEDKRNISLGKELARGGEGVVYEIDSTTVAKIYFEPKGRLDKMKAFIRKKYLLMEFALLKNCCLMKIISLLDT